MKWIVLFVLGCTPKSGEGPDSGVDNPKNGPPSDTGETQDEDLDLSGLNGRIIDPPLAAIDFSAVNLDGSERERSNLVDRRTVMWFYPAAGTYG